MQIVPTSLVRISRYYMLTAVGYLLITLAIGVLLNSTRAEGEHLDQRAAE